MTNKKILPTLLKINIITLFILFSSVLIFNVHMALKIRNLDNISSNLHDFADLGQYAITLVLQVKSLKPNEDKAKYIKSISDFENELKQRLAKRKQSFLKAYPLRTFKSLKLSMKNMTNLNQSLAKTKSIDALLDDLESTYIDILTFSNKHHKMVDDFFVGRMKIFVGSLLSIIIFVLILLNNKIRKIIIPLKDITEFSAKLSINQEESEQNDINFQKTYHYQEYQILANSLKDMHQRIHLENRMSSHESSASSISSFAENLAHSINNPLAIIATSIKILGKKANKNDDEYTMNETKLILSEIERITDITHQMKSLIHTSSKSEAEYFKVNNLITNINLLFFNKLFEKNIRFNYDRDCKMQIFGKEDLLNQILETLFDNAILYNDSPAPMIDLIFEKKDDKIFIILKDNGSAPSREEIQDSFHGKSGTNKLGLYTAFQCAQKNEYTLYYKEDPKEFVVEIPHQSDFAQKKVS